MVRWIREEEKLRGFWSGSEILLHTLINKLMNTYTAHVIEFQSPKNLDTAPPTFSNLSRSFEVVWLSNYHFLSCYLSVHSHSLGPGYIARLLWPYWNKKYGPFLKYWLYGLTFLSGYITYYAMGKIDFKLSFPVQPNFPGSIAKYCLLYNQIFWAQSSFLPMLRRTQIQPAEGLDS